MPKGLRVEIVAELEANPTATFASVGKKFGRSKQDVHVLFHTHCSVAAKESKARAMVRPAKQKLCKWCQKPIFGLSSNCRYHPECQVRKNKAYQSERQKDLYRKDPAAYYLRVRACLIKRRARCQAQASPLSGEKTSTFVKSAVAIPSPST